MGSRQSYGTAIWTSTINRQAARQQHHNTPKHDGCTAALSGALAHNALSHPHHLGTFFNTHPPNHPPAPPAPPDPLLRVGKGKIKQEQGENPQGKSGMGRKKLLPRVSSSSLFAP